MKKLNLLLCLILSTTIHYSSVCQNLFISKSSSIIFFSEALLENITASNEAGSMIINVEEQELAVKIPIKKFTFLRKLMQEHFNETFMESTKYPYATFKGSFMQRLDFSKAFTLAISVSGFLTVHGVLKMQTIEGIIRFDPIHNSMEVDANFNINLDDFKVKTPSVLSYKIANQVAVKTKFTLSEMSQSNINMIVANRGKHL
jgi:polyisoprenoid-binding protein YceI